MKLRINIDPPTWKILAGAVAIFLTDLAEALAVAPTETMTYLAASRIVIHAAALAFIFLSKGGEEAQPAQATTA